MRSIGGVQIVVDDLGRADVQNLLRRHAEGMEASSPAGGCHYLDTKGLRSSEVTVWSAWDDGELLGVGALREIDPTHGEVKSMRTADDHLGRGVGRALLEHIVEIASQRGYERLSLETGSTSAFDPARRLYERFGFDSTGPFAEYEPNDFSRFYTLELVARSGT
jgi:putative acetyltransferase